MAAGWFLARRELRCGGCSSIIATGTPTRQMRSGLIRCVACTKKLLDEDPPSSLDAPAPTPVPPAGDVPLQPFVRPGAFVTAARRRLLPDYKRRGGGDE